MPAISFPEPAWQLKAWCASCRPWILAIVERSMPLSAIQELTKGSRVGQLVIAPVVIADFVTDLGAERGTGGFGSTGQ